MEPQRDSDGLYPLPEGAMDLSVLFDLFAAQGLEVIEIDYGDGTGRRIREIPEQSNELVRTGDEEKSQGTS